MLHILLIGAPQIDGEAAVSAARAFARQAGFTQPLALEHLAPDRTNEKTGGWRIGLNGKQGFVTLTLDPRGTVLTMSATSPSSARRSGASTAVETATRFARKVAPGYRFRPGNVGNSGKGIFLVDLDLLHQQLPYFNMNPHYGLRTQCAGDLVVWYQRVLDGPKPNALRTKVSAKEAMVSLRGYALKAKGDGVARLLQPDWPGRVRIEPELGLYKFEREARARLVWRANARDEHHNRLGSLRMYVDALTGKQIAPDDPAMR